MADESVQSDVRSVWEAFDANTNQSICDADGAVLYTDGGKFVLVKYVAKLPIWCTALH
jgi:hypothetical protein